MIISKCYLLTTPKQSLSNWYAQFGHTHVMKTCSFSLKRHVYLFPVPVGFLLGTCKAVCVQESGTSGSERAALHPAAGVCCHHTCRQWVREMNLLCSEMYTHTHTYTDISVSSDSVSILGSDDATTCHLVVLRHTGKYSPVSF